MTPHPDKAIQNALEELRYVEHDLYNLNKTFTFLGRNCVTIRRVLEEALRQQTPTGPNDKFTMVENGKYKHMQEICAKYFALMEAEDEDTPTGPQDELLAHTEILRRTLEAGKDNNGLSAMSYNSLLDHVLDLATALKDTPHG